MRIIILEDDQQQAELLSAWLEEAGHQCTIFNDGNAFIRAYNLDSYDMVLLDWQVPKTSGLDVLKHLRQHLDQVVPVVFITRRDSESDVVQALEAGADDFMSKPIRKLETLARVSAVARRAGLGDDDANQQYEFPPYSVSTKLREISRRGELIDMTQKEYELTTFLFKNIGRVISRGHLLEMVWGTSSQVNTRTVDTHISRLRQKLNLDAEEDWKLTSVYRHGYRLEYLK